MNAKDFDVLDNSLTLHNLTSEQKKSVARLMELAIDEARQKYQSFHQSVQRAAFLAGVGAGVFVTTVIAIVVINLYGCR